MSEAADEGLPPFAQPYASDFRGLEKMLDRTPGFFLLPVESASPYLGRVFAGWLSRQRWEIDVLDLDEEATRRDLAQRLTAMREASGRRVVLVLGPHDLDDPSLPGMFASLNMARDPIAEVLHAPLIWWGPQAFHLATWRRAPDFWSIAATPFRLIARRLSDAREALPNVKRWWTGAVNTDLAALTAALEDAVANDDRITAARVRLRIAEANLAASNIDAARAVLDAAKVDVRDAAPNLSSRWEMLDRAAREEGRLTREALHDRIRAHHERGALHSEIADLLLLAECTQDDDEALEALLRARGIASALEDLSLRVEIDVQLLFERPLELPDDLRSTIGSDAANSGAVVSEAVDQARVHLILARLALDARDLGRAAALAEIALSRAEEASSPELALLAHGLRTECAFRSGRIEECVQVGETWLALATDADNYRMIVGALHWRGLALRVGGRLREAAKDLIRIAGIEVVAARSFDTERLWIYLAFCALDAGCPDPAAIFAIAAVVTPIHQQAMRPALETLLDEIGPMIATPARALLDSTDRSTRAAALRALSLERERIESACTTAGIDIWNPDTWPTPSPDGAPPGRETHGP